MTSLDNGNISSFQGGGQISTEGSSGPSQPVQNQPAAQPESTISPSSQETPHAEPVAGSPQLSKPHDVDFLSFQIDDKSISASAFAMEQYNKMAAITKNILDQWSKSIEEQAELAKEYYNSPKYLAEHAQNLAAQKGTSVDAQIKIDNQQPIDKDIALKGNVNFQTWLATQGVQEQQIVSKLSGMEQGVKGIDNYLTNANKSQDPEALAMAAFVAGAAIVSVGVVSGLPMLDTVSTTQLSINPVMDALTASQVNAAMAATVSQNAAALGLFGTLFMVGATQTSLQTIAKKVNDGQEPSDLEQAEKYAKITLAALNSNQLNHLLNSILTHRNEKGQPINDAAKKELIAKFKVILLATAMAFVTRAKHGGMTGAEWRDLFDHPEKLNTPDYKDIKPIMDELRGAIMHHLADVKDKESLLSSLEAYYDEISTKKEFMDSGRAIKANLTSHHENSSSSFQEIAG